MLLGVMEWCCFSKNTCHHAHSTALHERFLLPVCIQEVYEHGMQESMKAGIQESVNMVYVACGPRWSGLCMLMHILMMHTSTLMMHAALCPPTHLGKLHRRWGLQCRKPNLDHAKLWVRVRQKRMATMIYKRYHVLVLTYTPCILAHTYLALHLVNLRVDPSMLGALHRIDCVWFAKPRGRFKRACPTKEVCTAPWLCLQRLVTGMARLATDDRPGIHCLLLSFFKRRHVDQVV